jgi:hypothetical protein
VQGRATQGKRVVSIAAGDRVVEVSRVARESGAVGARHTHSRDDDEAVEDQLDLMKN